MKVIENQSREGYSKFSIIIPSEVIKEMKIRKGTILKHSISYKESKPRLVLEKEE